MDIKMKPKTIYKKDKEMSLKEMQKEVGGSIEVAYDDGKIQLICNEEGKLLNLPYNMEATKLWSSLLICSNDGTLNDILVGDVLVLEGKARLS